MNATKMTPRQHAKYAEQWYEQYYPNGNIPKEVFVNYIHTLTSQLNETRP